MRLKGSRQLLLLVALGVLLAVVVIARRAEGPTGP